MQKNYGWKARTRYISFITITSPGTDLAPSTIMLSFCIMLSAKLGTARQRKTIRAPFYKH